LRRACYALLSSISKSTAGVRVKANVAEKVIEKEKKAAAKK